MNGFPDPDCTSADRFPAQLRTVVDAACREQHRNGLKSPLLGLEALATHGPGVPVAVLCSGGLDSATLAALAHAADLDVQLVEFSREGRQSSESLYVRQLARRFSTPHVVLDYPSLHQEPRWASSHLPELYSVYLVTAVAFALEFGARAVFSGLIYEDWARGRSRGASPAIIGAVNQLVLDESGKGAPIVAAPLAYSSKATVAALSLALGLSEGDSQSCECPEDGRPCLGCNQCRERAAAFADAQTGHPPNRR
jgi:7-cyano-7-deazaguanine synthase